MATTTLDISDKAINNTPSESIKPLTPSDTQGKISKSNSEADGADEKMLSNDGKTAIGTSEPEEADAKFSLIADKQNGEAKLDIGDLKPSFVGMGKEELMKYANDPFWVKLRWILFVLFWLVWLAMLIGAILIIIAAPKCEPPEPRTWWESGPLAEVPYDVDIETLDILKSKNVKGVIVHNEKDSYTSVQTSTEIIDFLEKAKQKDIKVIIGLNPTVTDKFFSQSEARVEGFADYYLWAEPSGSDEMGGKNFPPNNWLRKKGGSAWAYSGKRQQFYYKPHDYYASLNLRNPKVVDEFSSIMRDWLAAGVVGFRLSGVPHMLVDERLHNETQGTERGGYIHDEYGYYNHARTTYVEGIGGILKEWRRVAKNISAPGPFMLEEDLVSLDVLMVNDSLTIDLPKHSNVFTLNERVTTAAKMSSGITSAFNILGKHWPIWKYTVNILPSDVMNIIVMLLPGSIYIDKDMDIEPELFKIRETQSFLFGTFHHQLLANESVFAYQRVQAGNPGYIVACNPGDNLVEVDFSSMKNVSDEVTVQLLSYNYSVPEYHTSMKIPSNKFQMPEKSAAILTYVPK